RSPMNASALAQAGESDNRTVAAASSSTTIAIVRTARPGQLDWNIRGGASAPPGRSSTTSDMHSWCTMPADPDGRGGVGAGGVYSWTSQPRSHSSSMIVSTPDADVQKTAALVLSFTSNLRPLLVIHRIVVIETRF